jgi:hypothetical protein
MLQTGLALATQNTTQYAAVGSASEEPVAFGVVGMQGALDVAVLCDQNQFGYQNLKKYN